MSLEVIHISHKKCREEEKQKQHVYGHISHLTLWKILPDDNTNFFTVYFSQLYI